MPFVDPCRKRKMARGSLLNDIAKGKALAFSDAGLKDVLANFLKAPGEYGIKNSEERPTKQGKWEKKKHTMIASSSMASLDEIRSNYCQTVSKTTVLEGTEGKSIHHKGARIGFARTHMSWTSEWTEVIPFFRSACAFSVQAHFIQIIFSNKKKFNLDGADTITSYWRDLRKERAFFST
uniref:40S ribosomal protein S15 n=1 Tax=Heterorhabditis bacteriophora TaxID=37862 RepID=A0A1I7X8B0_HETBA